MSAESRPFAIQGLDHVVLRVADMGRALEFYCGALGCVEERRVERIGLVQLRAGRSMIDLVLGEPAAGRNMDHFAIRLEPFDETLLREHLARHGIHAGDVATRYGAEGEGPSLYITDPDGNTVELKGSPKQSRQLGDEPVRHSGQSPV